MTENTPTTMGDYAVLGVLGAGGMGRVYKVRNVITDRVEAIKVLLPDLQGHEEVAARFLREIKLVAGLTHPNIAGLHTALTINNQLVMVMEYVEGEPLSARLAAGALPVPDALNYIEQVLNALSYAHEKKIIHRDIKPANMMLTPQGIIKLMDFGIARTDSEPAKLTATGTTLGSINYMSPEQVKGSPVDERSDIYSVGISLYEMVTGEKPFHGDSNFSIMAAHINQAPTPPIDLHPDLPPGLNEIILTAIAKAPEERFQSAEAFSNAIRSVLNSVQDSRTMVQGSMNTVIADTAARAQLAPTAPITARSTIPVARPMPVAVAPMPAAQPSSHRGLYISLGALIVLVALLAAGLYMPSRKKTSAAGEPSSQPPAQVAQPVTPTSEAPVAAAPVETTPPV
ncbi:MAG TPA: serine/threonine-protein kinase, partial [Terriglobales bacterium]|nr:serine/threonine-protein kinase [Terriglobales bacterium]